MENAAAHIISMRMSDGNIVTIECHDKLQSAVSLAREYARQGYPDRYAVFTEYQSSTNINGIPPREGAYDKGAFISCILRPALFPSQVNFIGALTSVALAQGLEMHTDKQIGIGWVSDVYFDGEKIGGTSIEGKLDSYNAYEYIIVTFAVRLTEKQFPPSLKDLIENVFINDNVSVAMIVAKDILTKFFSLYPMLKTPSRFFDEYKKRFILSNISIKEIVDGKKIPCKVVGVDDDGMLIVAYPGGKTKKIGSAKNLIIPKKVHINK
jgi:BirA family biotin operon repressor/biotin-[acetyl-CoA-carboxylase] ligase